MERKMYDRNPGEISVGSSMHEVPLSALLHEPGCFSVAWPGCHVIPKLIFVAFIKHAEIPANSNQPG